MAEKKPTTYEGIMRELKAQHYAPIYYLMGDEPYYIDRIADYVATHVLTEEERDFNQTVLFGADTNDAQVADLARRYPMMAERQVVIVKEAQNIRSLENLEKYLRNPMASTVLVWCHKNGTINRNLKVMKLAEQVGVVFESAKLKEGQLPTFIASHLKEKQVAIDPKSIQMIADHIGADLHRLVSELDKLSVSLADQPVKTITPEMVEQQIGVSKEFNGFELRDAIIRKDVFKANQIINYFDKNPKAGSIYSFLPLLFQFFQNLMIVHYAPNNRSKEGVQAALDLRSAWGTLDYLNAMKNYSARKTMDIIDKLREADAKSKGIDNPNTPAGELMKEVLFFILH